MECDETNVNVEINFYENVVLKSNSNKKNSIFRLQNGIVLISFVVLYDLANVMCLLVLLPPHFADNKDDTHGDWSLFFGPATCNRFI